MPYHKYSAETIQRCLDILEANQGDLTLTTKIIRVPPTTLRRWCLRFRPALTPFSRSSSSTGEIPKFSSSKLSSSSVSPSNHPDLESDLDQLQTGLVHEAAYLLASIRPAVAEASLSDRALALVRLLDRIYKLAYQTPSPEEPAEISALRFIRPDLSQGAHHVENEIPLTQAAQEIGAPLGADAPAPAASQPADHPQQ